MRIMLAGIGFLSLIACGNPERATITSRPIDVIKTPEFRHEAQLGFQAVTIRTVDQKDREILNASCDLTGDGFALNIITPAIVKIPDFGIDNRDVVVYCGYGGATASAIFRPIRITSRNYNTIARAGGGLVGGSLGSSVANIIAPEASGDKTPYRWVYSETNIRFAQN